MVVELPAQRGGVLGGTALQQEALGLSPTRAKAINRALIEAGLVTMKDSPNGKRYGRRWALTDCTLSIPSGRVVGLRPALASRCADDDALRHLAVCVGH